MDDVYTLPLAALNLRLSPERVTWAPQRYPNKFPWASPLHKQKCAKKINPFEKIHPKGWKLIGHWMPRPTFLSRWPCEFVAVYHAPYIKSVLFSLGNHQVDARYEGYPQKQSVQTQNKNWWDACFFFFSSWQTLTKHAQALKKTNKRKHDLHKTCTGIKKTKAWSSQNLHRHQKNLKTKTFVIYRPPALTRCSGFFFVFFWCLCRFCASSGLFFLFFVMPVQVLWL